MKQLKLALLFLMMPEVAFSMSLTSVTMSDTPDASGYFTVQAQGSGFGVGPNIAVFDDFNNQTEGQNISLTSALIGQWSKSSSYSGVPKIVSAGTGKAFQIHDFTNSSIAQIEVVFPQKVSNVFYSYSVIVPDGRFFSGSSTDNTFPDVSSWKFTWISDGANGIASTTNYNVCTPTHGGKGSFLLAGNSVNYGWVTLQNSWSWHQKNYFSFGIQPDPNQPQTLPGLLYFQMTGKLGAPFTLTKSDTAIFPVSNTTSFDRVKFPGWYGNGDTSNFDAYYDDIYVATGPNAFARVELSDNTTVASSQMNITMPVVSWSDTNIQFKLHKEHLQKHLNLNVRVYDSKNTSTLALPLQCTICPKPPVNQ